MSEKEKEANGSGDPTAPAQPRSISRRAWLRGSATAMPALLTLHSGAALARSSNLVSAAPRDSRDSYGRALCLDTDSVTPVDDDWRVFDLSEPAYGRVAAIPDRNHKKAPHRRARPISEGEMCERGGRYFYRDRRHSWRSSKGWREVHVKQGVLVSATALTSFAGSVVVTDL